MEIARLNLLSPLFYLADKALDPFAYREGDGEMLFCFDLNEAQYRAFEPDKTELLGDLIFGARAAAAERKAGEGETLRELPGGNYLFAQKREILNKEKIMDLAVEIQAEALWQRLEPGKRLYLRYLFEDGRSVTQLFRPSI